MEVLVDVLADTLTEAVTALTRGLRGSRPASLRVLPIPGKAEAYWAKAPASRTDDDFILHS